MNKNLGDGWECGAWIESHSWEPWQAWLAKFMPRLCPLAYKIIWPWKVYYRWVECSHGHAMLHYLSEEGLVMWKLKNAKL